MTAPPRHTPVRGRYLLAVLLLVGVAFTTSFTGAQTRTAPRPKPRPAKGQRVTDGGAPPPAPRAGGRDAGASETVAQKTLDGGTKVFRFGELEIEGRLKNPQLVFFLRRVRAEFAAGDLGHRSFLRELGETKEDSNF